MILIEPRNCEGCRWWKRLDAYSETGICTSVTDNEYAATDLILATGADRGAQFLTYSSFSCSDFEPNDSHAD